jgi:hypothetical protein
VVYSIQVTWEDTECYLELEKKVDVFKNSSQVYELSGILADVVFVSVNGLVMTEGEDYETSNRLLTFTNQRVSEMESPTVQIVYWVAV